MALESDKSNLWTVGQRGIIVFAFGEFVRVNVLDRLTIQDHLDVRSPADDLVLVPFSRRMCGFLLRGRLVIDSSIILRRMQFVGIFRRLIIQDLKFHADMRWISLFRKS